jgi:hypothetical protein
MLRVKIYFKQSIRSKNDIRMILRHFNLHSITEPTRDSKFNSLIVECPIDLESEASFIERHVNVAFVKILK